MKKLTSVILILAILSSCIVFSGCNTLSERRIKQMKEDYIKQFNIENVAPEDVILEYYAGNYFGYEVVMLDAEYHKRRVCEEYIDGVIITYYDFNCLYAWKNGTFYMLSEVYKAGKLPLKSISEIANKFNGDVKYFIDTCDKFDFEEGYDSGHFDWENNKYYDKVNIWLPGEFADDIFNMSDWSPIIDYLGDDIICDILDVKLLDDFIVVFAELIMNNREFLEYSIERLTLVPGVWLVGPYSKYGFAQSSDSDMSDISFSWALNDIEVKRI